MRSITIDHKSPSFYILPFGQELHQELHKDELGTKETSEPCVTFFSLWLATARWYMSINWSVTTRQLCCSSTYLWPYWLNVVCNSASRIRRKVALANSWADPATNRSRPGCAPKASAACAATTTGVPRAIASSTLFCIPTL